MKHRSRPTRRAALLAAVVTLTSVGVFVAPATTTPAAAAPTSARDGQTSQTAGTSCWAIKQSFPASGDGVYWLWTPKLVDPQQFYCDMTTDGGGWVLVGRGREGWSLPYWGQDTPSNLRTNITGPTAFSPATLATPTVDGLLNGGRMDGLDDGIRLRRATNTAGTTWQEARLHVANYGQWSWAFGAGIYLDSVTFDGTTTPISNSTWQTNTTSDVQVANDTRRVTTYPMQSHNYQAGFSYGGSVSGQNNPTSYLWQYATENAAVPFTQVFVRPKVTEADVVAGGVAALTDSGSPATTVSKLLDRRQVDLPWAVTDLNLGTSAPTLYWYVKTIAQIGNTIYVGGKFRQVQHGLGGPTFTQSYLAAFDKDTGEWIPTFNPVIDGPVWKVKAAPDGSKLFVGGEFTNVNGVANTAGLAALDPTTGAPVSGWTAYTAWPSGSNDVRAMDISNGWLYIGGSFTRVAGGATDFVGPLTVSRLARVRLSDGRPDWTWTPSVNSAVWDVAVSKDYPRVYAAGTFTQLNGVGISPTKFGIVDTTTGATVPGLTPYVQNATNGEENTSIVVANGKVYLGGSQHFLHQYQESDFTLERSHIARSPGGDFQAIAYDQFDGKLYASCHCDQYQYQDSTSYAPSNYSRVNQINLFSAYDTTNNLEVVPEFHPTKARLNNSHGEGPWSLFVDSGACLWAGGDLQTTGQPTSPYYGGFMKFCPRDTQAPATPPNAKATTSGNRVTITWNATTDNTTDPIQYEILRDDPSFGTVVAGTTFDRTWTDPAVYGNQRYFVRALDAAGNRSASTSALKVTTPPPTLATLVASGATWSYRADGQNLGTAWRDPATDTSSWPTGASQLGWGGKGEVTTIPSTGVTSYFVKHVTVDDPSTYKTLTVRLKRDDGAAVYVNGTEVVRDNVPAGATATSVASSFTSGAAESTWFETTVPASLIHSGDNTIAVEVHQAAADNSDGVFDLELLARGSLETNPPTTPAVTVSGTDFASASLTWTASTDDTAVAGYLVQRDGAPVAWTTGTSFTDRGLTPATPYAYTVTAMDTSGNVSTPAAANATTAANPALVTTGDTWSFRADGVDLGNAWRQPGYDVSTWTSGRSQLGWGSVGEATVVPRGQVTQYFVKHVTVADPGSIQQLALRLKRDDGAAVYVNGIEVVRSNLPTGTLTASTYPTATVGLSQANNWYDFTVPGALLTAGDNVIAVELHQDSRSDGHAAFDLQLTRAATGDTIPPTRPTVSLATRTDTTLRLTWSGATDDTGVTGYVVRRNGATVGYTTATSFTDTGLTPMSPYSYQVITLDAAGNQSTPGQIAAATMGTTVLSTTGSIWSYRSDGTDLGTAWRQPGYDASTWASGPSQLGWGGRGEATVVPSGQITQYFVRHVAAPAPGSVDSYALRLKRDDGVAVYVNGTEVLRDNLPTGTLTAGTYPTAKVTAADGIAWKDFTLPASAFAQGDNAIAVELHQDSRSDTRAVFDLDLRAVSSSSAPIVTVTSPTANGWLRTNPAVVTGLCTTSAGTVTATLTGAQTATLTSPCVSNEWSVTTPLTDGTYSVTATQSDATGTGTSPATAFTVDTVAPLVTLTSPTAGTASTAAGLTFAGQCTTGEGAVTVAVTGTAPQTLSTPCSAGSFSVNATLATGSFTATARQTDAAGNAGSSAAVPFSVDLSAPVTTDSTASIGSGWKNSAQIVTLSPTDTGSGVAATYYTTDGSTPTTASAQGTTIVLSAEGTYPVRYFSVDALGNTEAVKTAATTVRIDLTAPATTDNTAAIGGGWKTTAQTVTLTPADAGSGVATTYFTTDGSTPTTASTKGTTITLSTSGSYTIRYFSVDAAGNAEPVQTAANVVRIDRQAPTTLDNTASIGNAWKTTAQTVTLTPVDVGGSGLVTTYYTTNGSTPTTASAQGTTFTLTGPGTYSVRYFSVDGAGNAEPVKTASTSIRIDAVAPNAAITVPANNASYGPTRWSNAGCSSTNRICGTASDATSGLATVRVSVVRTTDNQYWTGTAWSATATQLTPTGTTSWYVPMTATNLTSGASYTVTLTVTDAAGNVTTSASTFSYDTTAPTTTAVAATNHSGSVTAAADTFSVTFNEALDPSKIPATATLTLARGSSGNTTWAINGITNGAQSTGGLGYLKRPTFGTYSVTYAGSVALSNGNTTITFTVTGGCGGSSCSQLSTTPVVGTWVYAPATTIVDAAGNAATGTRNGPAEAMF